MESSNIRHNENFYNNNLYNQENSKVGGNDASEMVLSKSPEMPKKTDLRVSNSDSDFFKEDDIESQSNESEGDMDFNLKSTIAHLQGDLVYSIGVLISAVIINLFPNLRFFDSICTLLFSYVAFELTVPIFTESIRILLEGTPEGNAKIKIILRNGD
jgi:Co/Zn/Cd efflux system component